VSPNKKCSAIWQAFFKLRIFGSMKIKERKISLGHHVCSNWLYSAFSWQAAEEKKSLVCWPGPIWEKYFN
jgi:hypothetical protein